MTQTQYTVTVTTDTSSVSKLINGHTNDTGSCINERCLIDWYIKSNVKKKNVHNWLTTTYYLKWFHTDNKTGNRQM
jgi:hypothetical protein